MVSCTSSDKYLLSFNAQYLCLKRLLYKCILVHRKNTQGLILRLLKCVGWFSQVSVSLSANESMPGDPVTLHVRGEKGSCVCVATVDKSLYLLKPDFQLSPDKVGPELTVIFLIHRLL